MTPFELGQRFVGEIREQPGAVDHPFVQWAFSLCAGYGLDEPDETPWCSAWLNAVCWLLRRPRSKSAAARSWLAVARGVGLADAQIGEDIIVLSRGLGPQPGPETLAAPGHVGLYAGRDEAGRVLVLAGNQGQGVSVAAFPVTRILGIRRLRESA